MTTNHIKRGTRNFWKHSVYQVFLR